MRDYAIDIIVAGLVFAIVWVCFSLIKRELDRHDFNLRRFEYNQLKPINYRSYRYA